MASPPEVALPPRLELLRIEAREVNLSKAINWIRLASRRCNCPATHRSRLCSCVTAACSLSTLPIPSSTMSQQVAAASVTITSAHTDILPVADPPEARFNDAHDIFGS